jgi:hypothetical protein
MVLSSEAGRRVFEYLTEEMSLLDRFRGQPEWQHVDPSVRVSAVDDLDDDAQGVLLAIATEDADAGVRAAAVGRLTDPAALARIADTDADSGVQAEALTALRDIAVGETDRAVAEAALSGLSATKDLGEVARGATLAAVGLAALERVDAQKTISAVSRRSVHPSVRHAALGRVTDSDELLAVATKSDHRDIALAAFDRLLAGAPADREGLKTVAARARVKPVARRAKAALAALDAEPTLPSVGGREQRRERLCESVEALVGASDWDVIRKGLADAEGEWAALDTVARAMTAPPASTGASMEAAGTEEDPVVAERWVVAVAAVGERLVRLELVRSEAERARERHLLDLAARTAVCERLSGLVSAPPTHAEQPDAEQAEADQLVASVAIVRAEWAALASPPADPDAPSAALTQLQGRFDALLATADTMVQRRESAGDRLARLTELTAALEEISGTAGHDDLKRRWTAPHAEWCELVGGSVGGLVGAATPAEVNELVTRVEGAAAKRTERLGALRAERLKRENANLAKQERRCEELEKVLADEGLELHAAERALRTTRSLLGNLGRVPREGRDALTTRLRQVQTGLIGRAHELRGLVEWKQWANLSVQAVLCRRLEALKDVEDAAAVAKEYREVMLAWRQASEVQPGEGDEVWKRFKSAHDAVRPRVDAQVATENAAQQASLAQKQALCEEAERLAGSTDWVATAKRMTELQAEWKQVGPATRRQEREVWNRFRAACGEFFTRRRDDLAERKQVWSKNGAIKESLCQQAEALSEESDLAAAKDTVRRLQVEWKAVGPVRRARSETLWTRFRAACDQVFNRSQQASVAEVQEKVTARAAVCERLEALVPPSDADPDPDAGAQGSPEELAPQVAAIRAEWRQLASVPGPQERELNARFHAALAGVVERAPAAFAGTDLDPARNQRALERMCERVEVLLDDGADAAAADGRSPAEVLAAQWREALAANTMGARVDPAVQRNADRSEVKRLQAERSGLGVVLGEIGQQLSDRFRIACDRFFQQHPPSADRASRPREGAARPPRPPRPTRTKSGGR